MLGDSKGGAGPALELGGDGLKMRGCPSPCGSSVVGVSAGSQWQVATALLGDFWPHLSAIHSEAQENPAAWLGSLGHRG